MTQSTYYDLNLVEGSDTVNPLIVDVPNYETIDEVMHDNSVASIGTATELVSGNVHALTRDNPDAPVFRFTATSNWFAGDTVTVDGIQVTAKLPSGQVLGNGSYVINSQVLCCLDGTLLTFFVPAGDVQLSEDSRKLGGELPEYYATADGLDEVRTIANSAGVLSQNLNQKITTLVTETLAIGETTITLTDARILPTSIIDPYFNAPTGIEMPALSFNTITVNTGSVTMTFDAQETEIQIGIRIV